MKVGTIAIFLFLLLVGLPELIHAQTAYFPDRAFDDDKQRSRFRSEWYSKHLEAMQEPSLLEMSRNKENHVYRFLYLDSSSAPIMVRLLIQKDGKGTLTTKILSGQGGYEPGHVVKNKQRKLSRKMVEQFLRVVDEVAFWKTPSFPQMPPGIVGVDGDEWITEGVKAGEYHVVDRWGPERKSDRAIGVFLIDKLAKLSYFK